MQSYSNLKGSGISNCFLLLQNGFRCKDVAIGGSMWCSDRLRCELKAIDRIKECMHALTFLARAIVFVSAQTGSASVPVTVLRYAVIVTTRWLSWFKCFWFVSGPTHWLKMWWFVIFHVSMIFQALRTVFLISCKISMFQCSAKDAVPICSQSIVKLEIKAMSSFFHSWASLLNYPFNYPPTSLSVMSEEWHSEEGNSGSSRRTDAFYSFQVSLCLTILFPANAVHTLPISSWTDLSYRSTTGTKRK